MDQKRRTNILIGSAIERVEDLRLLRGRGQFVDDLGRENLLHAVILRSSVAHGRIRSIDAAAARTRPGVHAVITAAEIGTAIPTIPLRQDSSPAFKPFEQPVIAYDKVRYVGEPLAVVLAETAAAAEDALDAIDVAIDPLPAVVTSAAASTDQSLLFDGAGTNRALTLTGVLTCAVKNSRSSATPRCPWSRAACLPNGTALASPCSARPRSPFSTGAFWRSRWDCPRARSGWWKTMSAAASARAANSIRRIF